jgi:hypothetical protein
MQLLNFTLERQTELRKGVGIFFQVHHEQVQIREMRAVADGILDVRLDITSARHHTVLIHIAVTKNIGAKFAFLDFAVSGFEFPPVVLEPDVPPQIIYGRGHQTCPSTWAPVLTIVFVIWNHVSVL